MARPRKRVDAPDLATRKAKLDAEREELDAAIKARVLELRSIIAAAEDEYCELTGYTTFGYIGDEAICQQFEKLLKLIVPDTAYSATVEPPSPPEAEGHKGEGTIAQQIDGEIKEAMAPYHLALQSEPNLTLPEFLRRSNPECRAKRGEAGVG